MQEIFSAYAVAKKRVGKYAFWISLLSAAALFLLLIFQGTPQRITPLAGILYLLFSAIAFGGFLAALVGLVRGPVVYSLVALSLGPIN